MNREIKFRAWDKERKEWLSYFELGKNGAITCYEINETQNLIIQQYTGLHDKNGVEIYFEDFVEDENGDIFIVKWNKTKIDLINISNCAIIDMKDNLIIKSNIYENEFKFSFNHTEIP